MKMQITGGCHCGNIRYQAEIDDQMVHICHCTDCQRLSGSAFRVTVPAVGTDLTFLSGKVTEYIKKAHNGNPRIQAFCSNCGAQIYATAGDDPHPEKLFNLRVGTIDQSHQLIPSKEKWTASKLPWVKNIKQSVLCNNDHLENLE